MMNMVFLVISQMVLRGGHVGLLNTGMSMLSRQPARSSAARVPAHDIVEALHRAVCFLLRGELCDDVTVAK
jgi:hypothetical protein